MGLEWVRTFGTLGVGDALRSFEQAVETPSSSRSCSSSLDVSEDVVQHKVTIRLLG